MGRDELPSDDQLQPDAKRLDEALLRVVARRLGELSLVDTVRVFPRHKPESVVARLVAAYYPDVVRRVELECRAYQNGDFNVSYREVRSDGDWMCRWDRHDNPHNSRDHYHRPPKARTEDAVDATFPVDFLAAFEEILGDVDDRLGACWEEAERS